MAKLLLVTLRKLNKKLCVFSFYWISVFTRCSWIDHKFPFVCLDNGPVQIAKENRWWLIHWKDMSYVRKTYNENGQIVGKEVKVALKFYTDRESRSTD